VPCGEGIENQCFSAKAGIGSVRWRMAGVREWTGKGTNVFLFFPSGLGYFSVFPVIGFY